VKISMVLKKVLFSLIMILTACTVLTSCLYTGAGNGEDSVVMIKNGKMSSYGTGFAVGVPGKKVEYIVTSYSVVATANGAIPKGAYISVKDAKNDIYAEIVYCDIIKNVAILKSASKLDNVKPMYLTSNAASDFKNDVSVFAYDGTGNLMSNYEEFNKFDVVSVVGKLRDFGRYNFIDTYLFTTEFNRAVSGAPAVDYSGQTIGMCAYSSNILDRENSQYILASYEIVECLVEADIDFLTKEEAVYRNVSIITVCVGVALVLLMVIVTVIKCGKGKDKNKKPTGESAPKKSLLRVTSGVLGGFAICPDNGVTIGRNPEICNVLFPLSHPGISGNHCSVIKREDGLYLIDNFSKCGTFLANGMKLTPNVPYKVEGARFVFYVASPENTIEITQ